MRKIEQIEYEITEVSEAYVAALMDLTAAICLGDVELTKLEMLAMSNPNQETIEAVTARKTELINIFTQKSMRGGLN